MLALDLNGGVSLAEDDHETEDGLVKSGASLHTSPPPSAGLRAPAAPPLREHHLSLELRPPIA
jgi:hypothetical protein